MYTMKIEINDNNIKSNNMPMIPFVISVRDSDSFYIITNSKGKYLLTDVYSGNSYENYTEEDICYRLNNGTWVLRKSRIVID